VHQEQDEPVKGRGDAKRLQGSVRACQRAKECPNSDASGPFLAGSGAPAPVSKRQGGGRKKRRVKKLHHQPGEQAAGVCATRGGSESGSDKGGGNNKRAKRRKRDGAKAGSEDALPKATMLSALAAKTPAGRAAERLKGSRFRWLNDVLYSTTGAEAKALYDKDPSLATAYHEGFRAQRAKWPHDPLDDVISWLRRDLPQGSTVGDFGCGEARIAAELKGLAIHSFDLIPVNSRVTACNLADVPLPDASLDVVVFCLALMGTDWADFLAEAHRCLRPQGLCHIVEVESRFADIDAVIERIEAIGFRKVFFKPGDFFLEFRFARMGSGNRGSRKRGRRALTGGPTGDGCGEAILRGCSYRRR